MTPTQLDDWIVLVNQEGQYSLWPATRPVPLGWRPAACRGTRDECIRYVDAVWVDTRPESLRADLPAQPCDGA